MDEKIELEYEICFHCGQRFVRKRGNTQIACQYCITLYLKDLNRMEVGVGG